MLRTDPHHCALPQDDMLGFIHVLAGKFIMGSDNLTEDEKPAHEVNLTKFCIAGLLMIALTHTVPTAFGIVQMPA